MRSKDMTTSRASRIRSEGGSAYLAVLLVLLVLTIMGLSLATITNLEMEIGTAERAVTRTFYASNSGLQIALAQVLARRDYAGQAIRLFSGTQTPYGSSAPTSRGFQIAVSPMVPIGSSVCNYCPANEGEDGRHGPKYFRVNHAVTSTATELTWAGDEATPADDAQTQAQKTLTVMFEMQPFERQSETIDLTDEEEQQVKF